MRTAAPISTGMRFGSLLVTGAAGKYKAHDLWSCVCDCGTQCTWRASQLRTERKTSCGCAKRHGHSPDGKPSATYVSWASMVQRCTNPKEQGFQKYGARGVTVCGRWLDFKTFLSDMGERPVGTTIDRIDGSRGYEPGNCRWADKATQAHNKSNTVLCAASALLIRYMSRRGERGTDIAHAFGVLPPAVNSIIHERTWKPTDVFAEIEGGAWCAT